MQNSAPAVADVNLSKLSAMLRTKRGDKGLRAVAEEMGDVSASTLSRIEQGKLPDLETFMRICKWLEVSPGEFAVDPGSTIPGTKEQLKAPQLIEAHLRADRVLPPATIQALSEMIRLAYKAANEGKLNKGPG